MRFAIIFVGIALLTMMPVDVVAMGLMCGVLGFVLYTACVIHKDSKRKE